MSDLADITGERGESLFRTRVQATLGGRMRLRSAGLGAKWPLFDALLMTERGEGPAFASVRTTAGPVGPRRSLPGRWTPRELRAIRRFAAPAFLIGVDLTSERVFLLAANGGYDGPVARMPTAHPLDPPAAARVADEIDRFWDGRAGAFRSTFLPPPRNPVR